MLIEHNLYTPQHFFLFISQEKCPDKYLIKGENSQEKCPDKYLIKEENS